MDSLQPKKKKSKSSEQEKHEPSHEACAQRVLQSFVKSHGFVSHALDSFEHFLRVLLPDILQEPSPVSILSPDTGLLHRITFENIHFAKPSVLQPNGLLRTLFPHEAHIRKQSYTCDVCMDVRYKVFEGPPDSMKLVRHELYEQLAFTKVPCMLGSSLCHTHQNFELPPGERGAFIVNGYFKVLVTQSQLRSNYPYIFATKPGKHTHKCEIRCQHPLLACGEQFGTKKLAWKRPRKKEKKHKKKGYKDTQKEQNGCF